MGARTVRGTRRSRPSPGAVRLFFDGASTPNPGVVETNVHLAGRDWKRRSSAGTAPQAVWLAIFRALYIARRGGHRKVVLVGDSKMVFWHAGKPASRHNDPIARVIDRCEAQFGVHFDEITVELVDAQRNVARRAMGRAKSKASAHPVMWHAWH